jgi:hypothetical protein
MASFYAGATSPVRPRLWGTAAFSIAAVAGLLLAASAGCGLQPASAPVASQGEDRVAPSIDRRPLCKRIDAVLTHARDERRLDASVHGAWQVVHGILAFGREFPLRHDGAESAALDYLLDGGRLTGWILRSGSPGVVAVVEEGSTTGQGHPDQWLGYLSQCGRQGIPRDTKLMVGNKTFTVNDLLTQAQADIRPGREATWTLMALSAYLPIDAAWTASDGAQWSTERVVEMEADADIFASACGGAHRLYGLVAALKKYRDATGRTPEQLAGGWAAAQDVIDECVDRARRFQQADGSFSIHSFERPGTSADVFARLSATGHIFEVLSLSLDDEQLAEPWVTRAADRLVTLLEQTADVDVECGALYHAAHGLLLYRNRVCGSTD